MILEVLPLSASKSNSTNKEKVLPELTRQVFMDLGKEAYAETNLGLFAVFELMYKKMEPYMKYMRSSKQVVSGYHRPVCVKCHCELHPETNGVGLLDLAVIGKDSYEDQRIKYEVFMEYELFNADLWKCPKCGMEIVGGFAYDPIAVHFQPE